ncbi:hypothetical protein ACTMSW_09380 [Micromonospora sp. BQ11]|uniref:hypothetical protein n=1 Tax=Micromonospora sp. BQ11 TaxID=3452212 RepID=UPI003F8C2DC5
MTHDQNRHSQITSLLIGAALAVLFLVLGLWLETWVAFLITFAVALLGYGVRRLTARQGAPDRGRVVDHP